MRGPSSRHPQAGSHDYDIWSPNEGEIQHDAASGFSDVVEATYWLCAEVGSIPAGVVVEPKKASVPIHHRHDRLKVMPGKIVYELQPKIDCQRRRPRDRQSAADFVLSSPTGVEQVASTLAR